MEISRPKDIKGGGQALSHFILQPMIKIKKKRKGDGGRRKEKGKKEGGGREGEAFQRWKCFHCPTLTNKTTISPECTWVFR